MYARFKYVDSNKPINLFIHIPFPFFPAVFAEAKSFHFERKDFLMADITRREGLQKDVNDDKDLIKLILAL